MFNYGIREHRDIVSWNRLAEIRFYGFDIKK